MPLKLSTRGKIGAIQSALRENQTARNTAYQHYEQLCATHEQLVTRLQHEQRKLITEQKHSKMDKLIDALTPQELTALQAAARRSASRRAVLQHNRTPHAAASRMSSRGNTGKQDG